MKTFFFFVAAVLSLSVSASPSFYESGRSTSAINNLKIFSWNLKDFGKTKSDEEINFIASILHEADIVAIQEVVAGYGGAQAIARLADALNRKGDKWDYSLSNPTFSSSYKTERYAFLWKDKRVKKIGKAWLDENYKLEIDREPYFATFRFEEKVFTLVNFHAITKSKQPETEIKYFKFLPQAYPELNLIFCGDFNLPQDHTVFNPLKKMGYSPALLSQKTSLKKACSGQDCLSSEFDNFFYRQDKLTMLAAGIIHFYKSFDLLEQARVISDHVPVFFEMSLN